MVAKIGNGTIASVRVYSYETKFGSFIGLSAIKVNELKEYTADKPKDSFEDDGYAAIVEEVNDQDTPF